MKTDQAFTLIEVLLAVVLLAMIVGVCVPFLSGRVEADLCRSQSVFLAQAEQLIAHEQVAQASALKYEDYARLASTRGWSCVRVSVLTDQSIDGEQVGEWIELSDGVHDRLCWAAFDPREKIKP